MHHIVRIILCLYVPIFEKAKSNLLPQKFFLEWTDEEKCDVLMSYKNMMLEGSYKNNFKELSRRMADMGWERSNNQCRQQVLEGHD